MSDFDEFQDFNEFFAEDEQQEDVCALVEEQTALDVLRSKAPFTKEDKVQMILAVGADILRSLKAPFAEADEVYMKSCSAKELAQALITINDLATKAGKRNRGLTAIADAIVRATELVKAKTKSVALGATKQKTTKMRGEPSQSEYSAVMRPNYRDQQRCPTCSHDWVNLTLSHEEFEKCCEDNTKEFAARVSSAKASKSAVMPRKRNPQVRLECKCHLSNCYGQADGGSCPQCKVMSKRNTHQFYDDHHCEICDCLCSQTYCLGDIAGLIHQSELKREAKIMSPSCHGSYKQHGCRDLNPWSTLGDHQYPARLNQAAIEELGITYT